jgi:hypothetical protein
MHLQAFSAIEPYLGKPMRISAGKLVALAAALGCFFIVKVPAAAADNYTYTFTTAAPSVLAGTGFEIESIGGFLSFGAATAPTSVSDLFYMGTDEGLITSVEFNNSSLFTLDATDGDYDFNLSNSYDVGAVGSYPLEEEPTSGVVVVGTLDIADVGSSGSPVPEPPSLILLAAGLVALILLRRTMHPFAS